jgi:protein ImuA
VLWRLRGRDLFAPALARIGLHPDRVIYCETWKDRDVLPAMEAGLRCAGLAAVVGEVTRLSLSSSRRLQLCAGESGMPGLPPPMIGRHNFGPKSLSLLYHCRP